MCFVLLFHQLANRAEVGFSVVNAATSSFHRSPKLSFTYHSISLERQLAKYHTIQISRLLG